jgi:exonuclease V gamma subunit
MAANMTSPSPPPGGRIEVLIAPTNRAAMAIVASRSVERAASEPFSRQVVLVDNRAIGENVVNHVAESAGLTVGLEPVLLSQFVRQVAQAAEAQTKTGSRAHGVTQNPGSSPSALSHQVVALAILQVIPGLAANGSAAISPIANDIVSEPEISTKLALASELARSFDTAIQASLDDARLEPWVAELKAALAGHAASLPEEAGGRLHDFVVGWAELLTRLEEIAADTALGQKLREQDTLPGHLFAFDLTVQPGSPQARALELLATITAVTLVLVDPAAGPSAHPAVAACPAAAAWAARSRRPIVATREALGEAGRGSVFPGPSPGAAAGGNHALAVIQQAVASGTLPAPPAKGSSSDRSLSIHHVASDARAAEVVRDAIHHAFVDLEDLLPEQVVVVSDDPRRDAPFIESAFDACADDEQLPRTLTGDSSRDRDSGIDAFLKALRLAPTSFAREAVFRLIAMPSVAEALRLEADKLDTLDRGCQQAGLRAYIDAEHREAAIGVSGQTDHCTWTAALRSLAAAMAVPDGGGAVVTQAGIVPAGGVSATDMNMLAAMTRVHTLLRELRGLATGGPIDEMIARCRRVADTLFAQPGRWMKSRAAVCGAIDAVARDALAAGYAGEVGFFWFAGELTRRLDRPSSKTCSLYGGVSLLKPAQARGRSPRVTVFLLSERFPTEDRPLWPSPFARGGPGHPGRPMQQHADLRDVFTVFMNTSERVIFIVPSMCGRTRERLSMSSVVHDVRAIAESLARLGVTFVERDESVVAHSLSAVGSPIATRHRGAIRGARALADARQNGGVSQMFGTPDPGAEVPREISLEQFVRFFEKPFDVFLQHREVTVRDVEDEWRVREAIHPTYLERWTVWDTVYQAAAAARGRGETFGPAHETTVRSLLRASGLLRADQPGDDYLAAEWPPSCDVERAVAAITTPGETPIDVTVDYTLHGHCHHLRIHGTAPLDGRVVIDHRLGSVKPRHLLAMAALEAVCRHQGVADSWKVLHIARGQLNFTTSASDANFVAHGLPLEVLARLWHLGLQMPLPIFADAIEASLPTAPNQPHDLHAAAGEYYKTDFGLGGGQGLDLKPRIVFRGQEPVFESRFPAQPGIPACDFERLAAFFAGGLPDAFPML